MKKHDTGCTQAPGLFHPVIDRNRCEGKAACVDVCPYEVFTVGTLPADQRMEMSFLGKLKGYAHKWQQAFTPNAEACHACSLCVAACPENAIRLVRV
jgi:NAD-dependent dihydropyrimidine dehydrogenase PreA subunit